MKKQILLFQYNYLHFSETFIYRQLLELRNHFEITILTDKVLNLDHFSDFSPILIPRKTTLEKLYCRLFHKEYSLRQEKFIKKYLDQVDLFLVQFGNVACELSSLGEKSKKPLIGFFWGNDGSAWLRAKKNQTKLKKAKFKKIFCNSQKMLNQVRQYISLNTYSDVLFNGIPVDKYFFHQKEFPKKGLKFLQICRFIPKKGILLTLEVFKEYISKFDSSATYTLVGYGSMEDKIKNKIEELHLEKNVHLLGRVSDKEVPIFMKDYHVFLQHSITDPITGETEGIPTVIAEAMACGMVVVSSKHSGIPELILDKVNGFLSEENNKNDFFNTLTNLNKYDLNEISHNARQRVIDIFSAEKANYKLVKELKSIY